MKPFDGGAWVGVSQVRDADELRARYDDSGQRLMHLQRAVDGFDVFARSLSIGPETMVMRFEPDRPLHDRYQVDHDVPRRRDRPRGRDDRPHRERVLPLGVQLVRDADQATARSTRSTTPTPARTSADLAALLLPLGDQGARALEPCSAARPGARCASRWTPEPWFAVADSDATYEEKLDAYRELADDYFEAEAYEEFCDRHLGHVDEVMADYIGSPEFDALLVDTVTRAFPPREHEQFVAHYRGLLGAWLNDQG